MLQISPGGVVVPPTPVSIVDLLGDLPVASTETIIGRVPRDQDIHKTPGPQRLHPREPVRVHRDPDGEPMAIAPPDVLDGLPLWMPVIKAAMGWALVLLPCRPDGAVGWIRLDQQVVVAINHVHIEVDVRACTVTVVENGDRQSWPAGVGKPSSPTPRGRTFVLGMIECSAPGLVDEVLTLAAHALTPTHLTYRAGISEIGMHTWPVKEGFGRPGGDGSVLVPAEAMAVISARATAGTPVLIR